MKLLTKELRSKLPPLYAQEELGDEAIVHIKFFTPDAQWTWFITEGSPVYESEADKQAGIEADFHFFGLVDGIFVELGYCSLNEIKKARGGLGLPVERDRYWKPKTLREVKEGLNLDRA